MSRDREHVSKRPTVCKKIYPIMARDENSANLEPSVTSGYGENFEVNDSALSIMIEASTAAGMCDRVNSRKKGKKSTNCANLVSHFSSLVRPGAGNGTINITRAQMVEVTKAIDWLMEDLRPRRTSDSDGVIPVATIRSIFKEYKSLVDTTANSIDWSLGESGDVSPEK